MQPLSLVDPAIAAVIGRETGRQNTTLELIYLVTNEYDGSDELGFAWDDPTAAVPWPPVPATPDGRPILSERDRTNPTLPELVARLRTGG